MAKRSKTQRQKASEKRAAKKVAALEAENAPEEVVAEAKDSEKPKTSLFKKSESSDAAKKAVKEAEKKAAKPKKQRFKFFREVKSEMKRVTWPTRQDVLQWSGVVIVALVFFGLYVAVLDNAVITPLLVAFSGLGA